MAKGKDEEKSGGGAANVKLADIPRLNYSTTDKSSARGRGREAYTRQNNADRKSNKSATGGSSKGGSGEQKQGGRNFLAETVEASNEQSSKFSQEASNGERRSNNEYQKQKEQNRYLEEANGRANAEKAAQDKARSEYQLKQKDDARQRAADATAEADRLEQEKVGKYGYNPVATSEEEAAAIADTDKRIAELRGKADEELATVNTTNSKRDAAVEEYLRAVDAERTIADGATILNQAELDAATAKRKQAENAVKDLNRALGNDLYFGLVDEAQARDVVEGWQGERMAEYGGAVGTGLEWLGNKINNTSISLENGNTGEERELWNFRGKGDKLEQLGSNIFQNSKAVNQAAQEDWDAGTSTMSDFGKSAAGVGKTVANTVEDMVVNLMLPGAGSKLMALRVAGAGALEQDQREGHNDLDSRATKALLDGGAALLSNWLIGGASAAYDKSVIGKAIGEWANAKGLSPMMQRALNTEGIEEVAELGIGYIGDRVLGLVDKGDSFWSDWSWREAAQEYAVGYFLGFLLNAGAGGQEVDASRAARAADESVEFGERVAKGEIEPDEAIEIALSNPNENAKMTGRQKAPEAEATAEPAANAETPAPAAQPQTQAQADVIDILMNPTGENGKLSNSQVRTITSDPAMLQAFQEITGTTPDTSSASKTRNSIKDAGVEYLSGQQNQKPEGTNSGDLPRMSMEDFANNDSSVWNNIDYNDEEAKARTQQEAHDRMVSDGKIVVIPETTTEKVSESFPDLRGMKKKERVPILKEKLNTLKKSLRSFLTGLKNKGSFEFEVNGNILEAKLYDTGIKEVLQDLSKNSASMLYHSADIFKNAEYLYSTPDYDNDSDIYRWNYFYTPVQFGDEVVGVRIAVRDMIQNPESQIYNWGIKQPQSLGGGAAARTSVHSNASSDSGVLESADSSGPNVPQEQNSVNTEQNNPSDQKSIPENAETTNQKPGSGTVSFDGAVVDGRTYQAVDKASLNKKQKAQIAVMEKIAEATGVNVTFYQSQRNENGKYTGANGLYKDGTIYLDVNAGLYAMSDDGKRTVGEIAIVRTAAHEMTHFIEQFNETEYNAIRDYMVDQLTKAKGLDGLEDLIDQKMKRDSTGKLTREGAIDEIIADGCEMMLQNSEAIEQMAVENPSLAHRIQNWIHDWVAKIKAAFEGVEAVHEEAKVMMRNAEELQKMWDAALKNAAKNVGNENVAREGGRDSTTQYLEREAEESTPKMTREDIAAVQSIGDKSVNNFTSEEIKATERFARQYLREMGPKSPFFRAWFGDWRANDHKTKIRVADKPGVTRGLHKNADTGWDINIGKDVFNETHVHQSKGSKAAVPYLDYLDSIVENAVLLDSRAPKKIKSENTLLMHSMYAVADMGKGPELLKLTVEEMNDPNRSGTTKRAYKLLNIEKHQAGVKGSGNPPSLSAQPGAIDNVADLFAAVKSKDSTFNPISASKIVDENGKPLVVYHGTDADFTVFDRTKGRSTMDIQGLFFSPSKEEAADYGGKVGAYYLNIKNPAPEDVAYKALNRFKGQNEAGVKAREYLESLGYDGVVNDGEVIAFNPEQIKSATDNIGTFDRNNPDYRYQEREMLPESAYEGFESKQNQKNNRAEHPRETANPNDETDAEFDKLNEQHGSIEKGENPARDINVPKKDSKGLKVGEGARTVFEADATPEERIASLKAAVVNGNFGHVPVSNDTRSQNAASKLAKDGWTKSVADFMAAVDNGRADADTIALGAHLLNEAGNSTECSGKQYIDLVMAYNDAVSDAGSRLAAGRILKTLTPEGKLYGMEKTVEKMNRDIRKANEKRKPGKQKAEIKLDEQLVEDYLNAKTDEKRNEIHDKLVKNAADQVPNTFRDKFTALRYLNMLGNFKTQVRNLVGNTGMTAIQKIKNEARGGIEGIVKAVSGGKYDRQYKGGIGLAQRLKVASEDFISDADLKALAMGEKKFSDVAKQSEAEILDAKKPFSEKNPVGKFLNLYNDLTGKAMEVGDAIFVRANYADALAGYMNAHGITAADWKAMVNDPARSAEVDKARAFAVKQAQEATFRDTNAVSKFASTFDQRWGDNGNPVGKAIKKGAQGVIPFRKTPANVLVRMEEYSPLGVINTAVKGIQAAKGTAEVSEVIDSAAKSLTGTGLTVLGILMASMGKARTKDDDKDEEAFAKLKGQQDYSVEIGGTSMTMDWLSPASAPFFMGVEAYNRYKEGGFGLSDLINATMSITNPMLEMSMLSGVNDALDNLNDFSGDNSALLQFALNSAWSYLTQGISNTMLGQIEQFSEKNRQTYYTLNEEDKLPTSFQKKFAKLGNKTPGFDYQAADYIDAWGRKQANDANLAERAWNTFLNPGYVSKMDQKATEADAVIDNLLEFSKTQKERDDFPNVVPRTPSRNETVNGKKLSPEEYDVFATTKGQESLKAVTELSKSDVFKGMDEFAQGEAIKAAYEYAEFLAASKIAKSRGEEYKDTRFDGLEDVDHPALVVGVKAGFNDGKNHENWDGIDSLLKAANSGKMSKDDLAYLDGVQGFHKLMYYNDQGVGSKDVHDVDTAATAKAKSEYRTDANPTDIISTLIEGGYSPKVTDAFMGEESNRNEENIQNQVRYEMGKLGKSESEIQTILGMMQEFDDDEISKAAIVKEATKNVPKKEQSRIKDVITNWTKDRHDVGKSRNALYESMRKADDRYTLDDFDRYWSAMDKNGDGQITKKEYNSTKKKIPSEYRDDITKYLFEAMGW